MMRTFALGCRRSLPLVLVLVGAACDEGKQGGATGCEEGGDSGGADAVPIAVDCSFVFAATQIDITYEVSDERPETPVGGKLIAGGMLSDDEYEGRSFSLVVHAEDGSVLSTMLYQMDRTRLPHNEFWGDHGFTGLHSVNDPDANEAVQFACFARDPADPPHVWED